MTVGKTYQNFRKIQAKKEFFNKCMINNVLPDGLKLSLNLALGVNDPNLVSTIENNLELASSRVLETLKIYAKEEEGVLDNDLENNLYVDVLPAFVKYKKKSWF